MGRRNVILHAPLRIQAAGVRACLAPLLKAVEDCNDYLDMLWSPNLESRILEESGFIRIYSPIGRVKRGSIYQLVDAYTLFYLTFMRGKPIARPGYWLDCVGSGERLAWEGVAFERVCMWHERELKAALGIAGVSANIYAWRSFKRDGGAQIDLLIDRRDGVVNVCEMKFVSGAFSIGAKYAAELENKLSVFKEESHTDKSLHLTMITASGVKRNEYSYLVHSQVRLDDLFRM